VVTATVSSVSREPAAGLPHHFTESRQAFAICSDRGSGERSRRDGVQKWVQCQLQVESGRQLRANSGHSRSLIGLAFHVSGKDERCVRQSWHRGSQRTGCAPNVYLAVLLALSLSHLLNDTIQSLIPAVYPILKQSFALDFAKIGMITLTFQIAGALFQPRTTTRFLTRRPWE
jgi:hypothetical protein